MSGWNCSFATVLCVCNVKAAYAQSVLIMVGLKAITEVCMIQHKEHVIKEFQNDFCDLSEFLLYGAC